MFVVPSILAGVQAQMNAMRSLLPPVDASVIVEDLLEQGERRIDRLTFWTAILPDWIEPAFLMKSVRKLDAITDQLEHFSDLNR